MNHVPFCIWTTESCFLFKSCCFFIKRFIYCKKFISVLESSCLNYWKCKLKACIIPEYYYASPSFFFRIVSILPANRKESQCLSLYTMHMDELAKIKIKQTVLFLFMHLQVLKHNYWREYKGCISGSIHYYACKLIIILVFFSDIRKYLNMIFFISEMIF